jgi:diamine N-acetyltransferase
MYCNGHRYKEWIVLCNKECIQGTDKSGCFNLGHEAVAADREKKVTCTMRVQLQNGRAAIIRSLQESDKESLYHYLQNLSAESRSRFGPHPFDKPTINKICEQPDKDIHRYVAIDESATSIVAYMIIQQGMIEADQQRYAQRDQFFDAATTVTLAPSVADDWQSSGLGTAMLDFIEGELKTKGIRYIILWGGVQATNLKAVNFYKKNGYQFIASFWYDEKDNHDMIKEL